MISMTNKDHAFKDLLNAAVAFVSAANVYNNNNKIQQQSPLKTAAVTDVQQPPSVSLPPRKRKRCRVSSLPHVLHEASSVSEGPTFGFRGVDPEVLFVDQKMVFDNCIVLNKNILDGYIFVRSYWSGNKLYVSCRNLQQVLGFSDTAINYQRFIDNDANNGILQTYRLSVGVSKRARGGIRQSACNHVICISVDQMSQWLKIVQQHRHKRIGCLSWLTNLEKILLSYQQDPSIAKQFNYMNNNPSIIPLTEDNSSSRSSSSSGSCATDDDD